MLSFIDFLLEGKPRTTRSSEKLLKLTDAVKTHGHNNITKLAQETGASPRSVEHALIAYGSSLGVPPPAKSATWDEKRLTKLTDAVKTHGWHDHEKIAAHVNMDVRSIPHALRKYRSLIDVPKIAKHVEKSMPNLWDDAKVKKFKQIYQQTGSATTTGKRLGHHIDVIHTAIKHFNMPELRKRYDRNDPDITAKIVHHVMTLGKGYIEAGEAVGLDRNTRGRIAGIISRHKKSLQKKKDND